MDSFYETCNGLLKCEIFLFFFYIFFSFLLIRFAGKYTLKSTKKKRKKYNLYSINQNFNLFFKNHQFKYHKY
jgi:hypothetical protein